MGTMIFYNYGALDPVATILDLGCNSIADISY